MRPSPPFRRDDLCNRILGLVTILWWFDSETCHKAESLELAPSGDSPLGLRLLAFVVGTNAARAFQHPPQRVAGDLGCLCMPFCCAVQGQSLIQLAFGVRSLNDHELAVKAFTVTVLRAGQIAIVANATRPDIELQDADSACGDHI
ncbi:hypothetical protein [Bradyrhizobium sp. DASA03120]|uniref:hypothetical protein n=1 Tax=Bradyrhizobium sp. SMVTL-02 TaxID=3395917 RepID=UPI003F6F7AD6